MSAYSPDCPSGMYESALKFGETQAVLAPDLGAMSPTIDIYYSMRMNERKESDFSCPLNHGTY